MRDLTGYYAKTAFVAAVGAVAKTAYKKVISFSTLLRTNASNPPPAQKTQAAPAKP